MTVLCQVISRPRLFETLNSRVFFGPTLRNLTVYHMGLLEFSLSEAVGKAVYYQN